MPRVSKIIILNELRGHILTWVMQAGTRINAQRILLYNTH